MIFGSSGHTSSYNNDIVPYFSSGSSTRSSSNESSLNNGTLERLQSIKTDINSKFSDVKDLVDNIDDKFEEQLSKINQKLDNQDKALVLYKKKESDSMSKILAKIESDSDKHMQMFDKMMKEMVIARRETEKMIENKFQALVEVFDDVAQKTKENEENIKKHSKDIREIKQLLVHVMENQKMEKPKSQK